MTKISLRGMMLVAVSALALAACTSDSSNTDALTAANATIATKSATIAERDATIATKNATIADKDVTIAAKQASIDAANASIASLTTDKLNLLSTLVDRNQTIDDLEADIDDLEAEIAAANADIAALEADVADLEAELQSTVDNTDLTIAARDATIVSLNNTITTHLATIDARDASIVTKNHDIGVKNAAILGLQADVAGLEADKAGLEANIVTLEAQKLVLVGEKAVLVSEKAVLVADKATLETEKADLQSQVTNYNKTAFNANRGNTSYENGGYQRNVGVGALQPEQDAIAAAQADVTAKSGAVTAASTVYNNALAAAIDAQNDYSAAVNFNLSSTYVGGTLANYAANAPTDAAFYAEVVGLDLTKSSDTAMLVSGAAFAAALNDLLAAALNTADARDNALTAFNSAMDDLTAAQGDLTDANTALADAVTNKKGTAEAVRTAETAVSDAQADLGQKQIDAGTASGNQSSAQASYDAAAAFVVDPTYVGQTLATYFANLQSDAEFYADIMGLDVTVSADQGQLVSATAYATAVGDLLTALNNAKTANTAAGADVTTAQAAVTTAEADLDTAIANYRSDRRPQQSSTMTLYQADGSAVSASGAMVYKQSLTDNLQHGQGLVEAGRLTALFLLDANGDPTNVLVFEASMVGESSVGTPFTLPPGAATFESTSMVAGFAQLEGVENGINTYTLDGDTDAGSLTINFNTKTGTLVVDGLVNGTNQDFSVNANLTFDPINGTFSATAVNQAYTSDTTGLAEVATGNIVGELSAVADAFTAYIDTTDKTGINDVNVKIMTRIVGTGAVTLAP